MSSSIEKYYDSMKDDEHGTTIDFDRIYDLSLKHPKQERYKSLDGKLDYIDECAANYTPEEFRGAMKFTIGKYQSRLGKKDNIVQEVTKIADYANRWLQYEIKLENNKEK